MPGAHQSWGEDAETDSSEPETGRAEERHTSVVNPTAGWTAAKLSLIKTIFIMYDWFMYTWDLKNRIIHTDWIKLWTSLFVLPYFCSHFCACMNMRNIHVFMRWNEHISLLRTFILLWQTVEEIHHKGLQFLSQLWAISDVLLSWSVKTNSLVLLRTLQTDMKGNNTHHVPVI